MLTWSREFASSVCTWSKEESRTEQFFFFFGPEGIKLKVTIFTLLKESTPGTWQLVVGCFLCLFFCFKFVRGGQVVCIFS